MKHLISALACAFLVAACASKSEPVKTKVIVDKVKSSKSKPKK